MTERKAIITDGVSQRRRTPEAMEDDYFLPQERRLCDHIAIAERLSCRIGAVARDGGAAGDWRSLFAGEIAVAMARLLSMRPEELRDAFATALRRDPAAAALRLHALASDLVAFGDDLARSGYPALAARLDFGRGDERPEDAGPGALVARLAAADAVDPGAIAALAVHEGPPLQADPFIRARAARRALLAAHERLLGVVEALRPDTERAFAARLRAGAVEPALGLILAQLGLMKAAETAINAFVPRHRRFYHQDILGQTPREAAPETILLRFEPAGAPALIAEGALIEGRTPGAMAPRAYRLLSSVLVGPATVAESRTLLYERDPDISLQRSLGYVTGVRAAQRRVDGSDGGQGLFEPQNLDDALIGLEIDSDMLRLAEGRRRIDVIFMLRPRASMGMPEPGRDAAAQEAGAQDEEAQEEEALVEAAAAALRADRALGEAFAGPGEDAAARMIAAAATPCPSALDGRGRLRLALLRCADTLERLRAVIGGIVADTLAQGGDWPRGPVLDTLLERLQTLFDDGEGEGARVARDARAWFSLPPVEVYQQFLGGALGASLSSAAGFIDIPEARVTPNLPADGPGFRIGMTLDLATPPIAPAPGASAPTLRLRLKGGSLFCVFSLFEPFLLSAIRLETSVEGMTRLTARGDSGPIDPTQPFAPFGPAPRDGAAFVIGALELAVKPVTEVRLDLAWSGLPRVAGGFEEHYRGYGPDFTPPQPLLALSYLAPTQVHPLGDPVRMIADTPGEARLEPALRLRLTAPGAQAVDRDAIRRAAAQGAAAARSGAVRIELRCSGDAFGHGAYPSALAASMRPSLNPFHRRTQPSAPYTPTIARIALGYRAVDTIDLSAPHDAGRDQRLRHVTPFGALEVFPARPGGTGLFARRLAYGVLYLRIAGAPLTGPVSLLFTMAQSSHRRLPFAPEPVTWRYLSEDGWRTLPGSALMSDSTEGLMRSGVVRIAAPADAAVRSSEMPGEGLWLAACADYHLSAFPRLESVTANGARAVRVFEEGSDPSRGRPQDLRLADDAGRVAGLRFVAETVAGAPPETARAFHTRVAEGLRHRHRAITAWDAERLALELFPEVWKAKCFPATEVRQAAASPGDVVLVVVPHAPEGAEESPTRPRTLDVLTLGRIEARMRQLGPAFARLSVSNPSYEALQVRARVAFAPERDDGTLTHRLERDVSRMLSVWTAAPPMNGFGWSIALNEVEGFIARLDYVAHVTRLSLLQLVGDDEGRRRLYDTARSGLGARAALRWRRPWALPLPMAAHRFEIGGPRATERAARAGIGSLTIGRTLVVGPGAPT